MKFENIDAKNFNIKLKNKSRKAILRPKNLKISDFENDDFFKVKYKVRLEFDLEKGNYATMIIKSIFMQGKFGKAAKYYLK